MWVLPTPWVFGSQRYGLAGITSDVDTMVLAPLDVVERGDDVRAVMVRMLVSDGVVYHSIKVMASLQTLQWTDKVSDTEISILLTTDARSAIVTTLLLEKFYAAHLDYRCVVQEVLSTLRANNILNSHGLGVCVGQRLKTVTFAPLCAGVYAHDVQVPNLCTNRILLRALAEFDASAWVLKLKAPEKYKFRLSSVDRD
jgi:hypothetical protein